jgi:hypothetical protein
MWYREKDELESLSEGKMSEISMKQDGHVKVTSKVQGSIIDGGRVLMVH